MIHRLKVGITRSSFLSARRFLSVSLCTDTRDLGSPGGATGTASDLGKIVHRAAPFFCGKRTTLELARLVSALASPVAFQSKSDTSTTVPAACFYTDSTITVCVTFSQTLFGESSHAINASFLTSRGRAVTGARLSRVCSGGLLWSRLLLRPFEIFDIGRD